MLFFSSIESFFQQNFYPKNTISPFSFFARSYLIINGKVESEDIYFWNHENGSQRVVAPSLKGFIKGWYSREISI